MEVASQANQSITQACSLVKVGIGEGGSPNNADSQGSYKASGPPGQISGGPNFKACLEESGADVGGGGQRGNLDPLKAAWGDFLQEIGNDLDGYDWFCTFTFRDPADPKRPNWTKPGWNYAHTALRRWNDAMMTSMFPHSAPYWIAMMEYQHWRGVPHWHLLVGGTQDERRMDWVDWWFREYGIARILPYQAELGARFYLAKYLTKEMADVVTTATMRLSHRQLCNRA